MIANQTTETSGDICRIAGGFSVFRQWRSLPQGFYELTRNWVAGSLLAERLNVRFTLINLAPRSCAESASRFAHTVTQSPVAQFQFLDWHQFLSRLSPLTPWFDKYIRSKFTGL